MPPSASRATAFERALAEAGMDEEAGTADADVVAPVAEKEPASGSTTPASAPAAANPSVDAGDATDVADLRARLEAAESRLEALRADFHYNLALVKDRDAELEAQDETIASLERAIAQRDVAQRDVAAAEQVRRAR